MKAYGVCGLRGLSWRSLAVQGAHQHAEIEACDMDQIAFVDVLAHARRIPPRSRTWAKLPSTSSPRRRIVSRPIPDFSRTRLA